MRPRITFRRRSLSFDLQTIERARELAENRGVSVSAVVRAVVAEAYIKEGLAANPKTD